MGQQTNRNRHDMTITAGTTGSAVHIPEGAKNITVTLIPGTSGTVQYTTSSKDKIVGATATWIDWASGSVVAATREEYGGTISGIRASAVTSDADLEIMWTE